MKTSRTFTLLIAKKREGRKLAPFTPPHERQHLKYKAFFFGGVSLVSTHTCLVLVLVFRPLVGAYSAIRLRGGGMEKLPLPRLQKCLKYRKCKFFSFFMTYPPTPLLPAVYTSVCCQVEKSSKID